MSAVDKLHKLYSSTLGPVVWARSVGLEVLNEFDSVKAAIMMNAGAYNVHGNLTGDATAWAVAAKGVESLATGAATAKIVGQGVAGMVGIGVQNLLRTMETHNQQK
jgi:ubiquinone biosynthesis monooxygenase Coq6